jgi:hypothetical protein
MDSDMREQQAALEVGGGVASPGLLPLATSEGQHVVLRTPAGRTPLAPRAGELSWIHGPDGFVERLVLRRDVDTDALVVEGKAEAVHDLADLLAADAIDTGGFTWELRATDLWERASFVDAPGIVDVRPELRATESIPMGSNDVPRTVAGLPTAAASDPASADAGLVGVYSSDRGVLVLDAAGGFTLSRFPGSPADCTAELTQQGHFSYAQGVLELDGKGARPKFTVVGSQLVAANGAVMSLVTDGSAQ